MTDPYAQIRIYPDRFLPYPGSLASRAAALHCVDDDLSENAGQAVRNVMQDAINQGRVTKAGVYFATTSYPGASCSLWRLEVVEDDPKPPLRLL